ncbi:hypothetical protein NHP164001_10240 [Helicobacter trogontum]|uniref:Outer membrane lipoprotein carrier protein LolA n=1 Tax=Helicobacter trogontum TaxID=50960 RepID=A0ABQ0D3T8_9HELI
MKHILVIVALFFSTLSFGQNVQQEAWRNVKSIKADFTQEIKGEKGAIPVVYKGKLYAANNKVKWLYTSPLAKEVYLEKTQAYIYEPQLQQVTIGSLEESVDFIQILKRVQKIGKDSYKTQVGDITYYVIIKDSMPYELKYTDSIDNVVTIRFENVKMNTAIDNSVFIFQPPDDVEYIDGFAMRGVSFKLGVV